jgi:formate-dependent phosphoribosylglycinamide formyltransferase (GAR transformylase)
LNRLLVLGSSHAELPLVEAALSLGCFVATASLGDPGLAAMRSNHHYRIDYSEATLVEKLVREANFTSVVAGCNDFAAFTAARIADKLHMVNHDSLWQTTQIHLKDNFRGLCARLRIPSPRFFAITDDEDFGANRLERLTFPVIVKPVDLTGGKGIMISENASQAEAAVKSALSESRSKRVVIEDLIQGQLQSACFILNNGHPVLLTHAREFVKRDAFLVESALTPSGLSDSRIHRLTIYAHQITKELKLSGGLLHLQFISQGENDFLIEACRRPPGDLYLLLPTLLEDFSIADLVVRNVLGHREIGQVRQRLLPSTLRLCLFPPSNGQVSGWKLTRSREVSIVRSFKLRPSATEILDCKREKLGIVFLVGDDSVLTEIAEDPEKMISVEYRH